MGQEKRKHPRISFEIIIDSIFVRISRSEIKGITQNISIGGLGFITTESVTEKSAVSFGLFLPEKKEKMHIEGKIRWVRKDSLNYAFGIEFTDINVKDKTELKGFIEKQTAAKKFRIRQILPSFLRSNTLNN